MSHSATEPNAAGTSAEHAHEARCRFCSAPLRNTFVDLGMSPLCQKHLHAEDLSEMEPFYPLQVWVCSKCFLVQLEEIVPPEEIFGDGSYAYFSSYSQSWLDHASRYCDVMRERLQLGSEDLVVEIASNDGYLLRNFVAAGIPVLGIEPASNTAEAARAQGVDTEAVFFGRATADRLASERGKARLLVGNNVLAHVPDINDLVGGMKILLAADGVITMEFPHLLRLVEENQFDTIYHEHYSYLSFGTVEEIFAHHGLTLFDVEELPTHGGSLRIHGRHTEYDELEVTAAVEELRARERARGMRTLDYYEDFGERVKETKRKLLALLIGLKRDGKTIVGYGAPGKGNTLLNYCGVGCDFLDYTVDRSPHKQGGFLPGTHVPILAPEEIARTKPDFVLILPWNLREEIMQQMAIVREWDGKFIVPIPEARIYS